MFRVSTACVQRRYTLFCDARETYTVRYTGALQDTATHLGFETRRPLARYGSRAPVRGSTEAYVRVASFDVSEKSIYNRNFKPEPCRQGGMRRKKTNTGFVRSVFERKLTDGRSGLPSRARAARALHGTTGVGRSPERRAL